MTESAHGAFVSDAAKFFCGLLTQSLDSLMSAFAHFETAGSKWSDDHFWLTLAFRVLSENLTPQNAINWAIRAEVSVVSRQVV
jgi:hypothetical protein